MDFEKMAKKDTKHRYSIETTGLEIHEIQKEAKDKNETLNPQQLEAKRFQEGVELLSAKNMAKVRTIGLVRFSEQENPYPNKASVIFATFFAGLVAALPLIIYTMFLIPVFKTPEIDYPSVIWSWLLLVLPILAAMVLVSSVVYPLLFFIGKFIQGKANLTEAVWWVIMTLMGVAIGVIAVILLPQDENYFGRSMAISCSASFSALFASTFYSTLQWLRGHGRKRQDLV